MAKYSKPLNSAKKGFTKSPTPTHSVKQRPPMRQMQQHLYAKAKKAKK